MQLTTTYGDVVAHCAGRSRRPRETLAARRCDPGKAPQVVPFVERARTQLAYRLTPPDVEKTARETGQALGEARRAIAERVLTVRDWHPSFALEHSLHHAAETLSRLPTYGEFCCFCRDDAAGRVMLLGPARAIRDEAAAAGYPPDEVAQALTPHLADVLFGLI
jgi:hypothetical protein